MLKKVTHGRRTISVFLLGAGVFAVLLLNRNSTAKNEAVKVVPGVVVVASEIPSSLPTQEAASSQTTASKTGSLGAASAVVYRFETPFVAGKPETVASRFATPSAAETTLRSARLTELLEGSLSSLREGDTIALPLPDSRVAAGRINLVQRERDGQVVLGGELTGEVKGTFSLGEDDSSLTGVIVPADSTVGYEIQTGVDGAAYLLEKNKGSIVCVELPVAVVSRSVVREAQAGAVAESDLVTSDATASKASLPEYLLSSRPAAVAVAYLDFNGETVTDSYWNSGNAISASASGLSAAQITEVWQRVSEDYRPFNIDVTTDRARYDNAPAGSRMRCIITQSNTWYGSAGGVAYIGSWSASGSGGMSSTIPCWVFANLLSLNPRYVAEAASHEIGHTLGLSHDGLKSSSGSLISTYYSGHGTGATSWAPIMGSGYYKSVVQWSNGNYSTNGNVGNNTENDLAIISDVRNHGGYAADSAGASPATADALRYDGSQIATVGCIERTGDVDMYSFTTTGGSVSLYLAPESSSLTALANLDARVTLSDASGKTLADSNLTGSLYPSIATTLPAGTYYLAVTGVGEGDVPGTGYTNYASLGRYEIKGSAVLTTASPSSIVVDSVGSSGVTITGAWNSSTYFSGYLGSNYLVDVSTGARSGKQVRFAPTLPVSTAYDVYIRWTASGDRADNVPVDVAYAGGTKTLTVNQRTAHATWVFLGTFGFNAGTGGSVTVRNDGANGVVVVDAVKFEKADSSLLPVISAAIADTADGKGVSLSGGWAQSTYVAGFYGRDYLSDGNTSKSLVKRARLSPSLPVSGAYKVYARWTTGTNRATNVPVDIASQSGTTRVLVNQQANNGNWYLLGTYNFTSGNSGTVTISNENANGYVIADAVKFERVP